MSYTKIARCDAAIEGDLFVTLVLSVDKLMTTRCIGTSTSVSGMGVRCACDMTDCAVSASGAITYADSSSSLPERMRTEGYYTPNEAASSFIMGANMYCTRTTENPSCETEIHGRNPMAYEHYETSVIAEGMRLDHCFA